MNRTGRPCCGPSDTSGRREQGSFSIAIGTGQLSSSEGVSQGDPLSIFAYSLGLLPLIRQLKVEFPKAEQAWYADDAGAGGNFSEIRRLFKILKEIGPDHGYFPEPSKSILVVRQHNLEAAKVAYPDFGFKVTIVGSRYLGGFVGKDNALRDWLREKTKIWEEVVVDLASAAPNFPQEATYSGLQKSLQQEWQFVQQGTKDVGSEFEAVELALSKTFLPALFGNNHGIPCQNISCLPVKWDGLAILNPTSAAEANYEASILIYSHILVAYRGVQVF